MRLPPWLLLACTLIACGGGDDGGSDGGMGSADDGAAGTSGDGSDDPGARPRPGAGSGDGDGDGGDGDGGDGDGDTGDGDGTAGATPLPCDVAGVLEGSCILCHGQPQTLGAPMPLLSWEDLTAPAPSDADRPVYELVVERVLSTDDATRMPRPPNPALSRAQIDALERWVEDGAEPGDNDACLLPR